MKHGLVTALLLTLIMALYHPSHAETPADSLEVGVWETTLKLDLNAAQTAYSDSWEGGAAGSFTWVSLLYGSAQKRFNEWFHFKSTLKASFGQTLTQNADTKEWSKPQKATDEIDWENIGKFTLKWPVDPYVAARLETQFWDASYEPIARYFNPLLLTYSAGGSRLIYKRDKEEVTTRVGFALRQMIRSEIADTAAQSTRDTTTWDGGIEWVTDAQLNFTDRVAYIGKLTVFKAFFNSASDQLKGTPIENDWKAVDVNMKNAFLFKFSKVLAMNLYLQLIYDKELDKRVQLKEILGVGFSFTLIQYSIILIVRAN